MQIYVVMGSTGCFDDFTEWMVEGYCDETKANERISELEFLMEELGFNDKRNRSKMDELVKQIKEHERGDEKFIYWFGTEVEYHVELLELVDL